MSVAEVFVTTFHGRVTNKRLCGEMDTFARKATLNDFDSLVSKGQLCEEGLSSSRADSV